MYKLFAGFFAVFYFWGCSEEPSEVFNVAINERGTQAVLIGEKPGHLKGRLEEMERKGEWDPYALKKLILKGNLNGKDVIAIRELTNTHGSVEELDFSDANLLEGAFPEFAFGGSLHLHKVIFPNNLKYSGESLIGGSNNLTEIQLNEGLELLEYSALCPGHENHKLKEINIPKSVRIIGERALCFLSEVNHLDLPEKLDSIGFAAFDKDFELTELHIPSGIRHIAARTFFYCKKLKKIDLPDKITSIGREAFDGCEALENIKLPDSLKVISREAFNRSGLTSLELPPNLKRIEDFGLEGIKNIKRLVIPNSVEHIGRHTFTNLPLLKELHVKWNTPIAVPSAFESTDVKGEARAEGIDKTKVTLYVPKGSKAAYQTENDWKGFTNIVEE